MEIGLGHLAWSSEQCWASTLPELMAAWRGYQQRQQQSDYRAGVGAALFANAHRDQQTHPSPFTVADFFPSLQEPARRNEEGVEEIPMEAVLKPGETLHELGDIEDG